MSKDFTEPLMPSSPLTPGESKLLFGSESQIIVHFWSNFDSGDHKSHEMGISHTTRVLDIILESLAAFKLEHRNVSDYSLRLANGSGKPKTSMPAFEITQNALETRITRFALCFKGVEKQEKFQEVDSPVKVEKELKRVESLQQDGSRRRKFCCCFYSD